MALIERPQNPSQRVYRRTWSPRSWRGSLDEIVAAGQAVLEEVNRQFGHEPFFEQVRLDFADASTQDFGSLRHLQDAIPVIEPDDVTGVWVGVAAAEDTTSALIRSDQRGLEVSAEGSEAFASGIVATLKSRLAGGAEAGEQARRLPLGLVEWVVWGCAALMAGALLTALAILTEEAEAVIFFGILVVPIPVIAAWWILVESREKRRPPPFVLVAEGKQFPDEGERAGPVWTAKAWFEEHPLLAVFAILILGALLGRAADLIRL